MASPDGGAGTTLVEDHRDRNDAGDAEDSGSSYIGSDTSGSYPGICRWRTGDFHDQECSRYFDCPSHVVERLLEEGEAAADDADGSNSVQSEIYNDGQDDDNPADPGVGPVVEGDATGTSPGSSSLELGETLEGDRTASPGEEEPRVPAVVESRSPETTGSQDGGATLLPISAPAVQLVLPERTTSLGTLEGASPSASDLLRNLVLPPSPSRSGAMLSPRQGSIRMESEIGSPNQQTTEDGVRPPDTVLPRWQPDAEVTYCPICHTQFSIFVRKHHCRKCGRVVCNSCSPHRITIPYQYIVQPPGQPRLAAQRYPSSLISGEGGYADFSSLGGGERVRLCNPCVPDPNTTPPQPPTSPNQLSPRQAHQRSQSSLSGAAHGDNLPPSRFSGYFTTPLPQDAYARSRSVTHSGGPGSSTGRIPYQTTQNRIMAGTPPTYFPASSAYHGSSQGRYRSLLDVSSSSASSPNNRALPPPPQIPEEDECPVCHRELPSRSLTNFEALREAHVNICITSHSTYSGGSSPQGTGETPPPLAARRTGMFPYIATEKDCVDSAECTICLEEFEVGVPMARLECLCRFHRACISAWFVNHPGRCPVHQHDSFGY